MLVWVLLTHFGFLLRSFVVGVCTDSDASQCPIWAANGFCQSSFYTCDQKRAYCSSTCNIGGCNPQTTCSTPQNSISNIGFTTAPCVDTSNNCAIWKSNGFCTSTLYTCAQKNSYCAASCNISSCSSGAGCSRSNSCSDSSPSCAMWVPNGFCTASWYTCDQKRQYCASSCNIGGCNPQITCSGSVAATTKITTTPSTTIRVTTTTTIPVTTTTTTIPVTTTTTTIPATTTTTTIPVTTTTTTIPVTTTTTTIPVTNTTTTIPTTTTTPLVCLNNITSKINRYFCSSTHIYTINQTSLYQSCSSETICDTSYSDCASPQNKSGYLVQSGQQNICPSLIQVVSFRNTASPSSYENLLAFGASEISQYRSNPTNYTELETLGYCAQTSCYCGASMPLYYIVGTFSTGMLDHFYTTSFEEMNSINTNSGSIYYNGSKGIPCYIWKFNSTTQCNTYC